MKLSNFCILCLFILATHVKTVSLAVAKELLSVYDEFDRTILLPVQNLGSALDGNPFLLSPNRDKLLVITRKGIASDSTYKFSIVQFNTSEIKRYLNNNNNANSPVPMIIYEVEYDMKQSGQFGYKDSAGIKNLKWSPSGDFLYFISVDEDNIFQIFEYNFSNNKTVKITDSPNHVLDYIHNSKSNEVLFTVGTPSKSVNCESIKFRAVEMHEDETICLGNGFSLFDFFRKNSPAPYVTKKTLYSISTEPGSVAKTVAEDIDIVSPLNDKLISPDGKYLIVVLSGSLTDKYLCLKCNEQGEGFKGNKNLVGFEFDSQIHRPDPNARYYVAIGLENGAINIIAQFPVSREGELKSIWISDEKLYLGDKFQENGARNLFGQRVVSGSDNENGALIFDFSKIRYSSIDHNYDYVEKAELLTESEFIDLNKNETGGVVKHVIKGRCSLVRDGTDVTADGDLACYLEDETLGIRLFTGEAFNITANIYVEDISTGRKVLIYELNPQFKNLHFGKVEIFRWTDRDNKVWTGGLVLPVDFEKGRQYPLVIQTHGFDPNKYLMNGPYHDGPPFAAQLLANKGIVVLQLPNLVSYEDAFSDQPTLASAVNAAVKKLKNSGIIDVNNIGMIGFSFRGKFVFNMTVFPTFRPKAVIIADAVSPSMSGYSNLYWSRPPGMRTVELEFCDSKPWGESQKKWITYNPYFHIDNINTSILLVDYSVLGVSAWWDVVAGLRRLDKPIDYYRFTAGGHPPVHARTVIEARQLTIDWFDFWLNGRKDLEPLKSKQYENWEKMRQQLNKKVEPGANLRLSEMDCRSRQR